MSLFFIFFFFFYFFFLIHYYIYLPSSDIHHYFIKFMERFCQQKWNRIMLMKDMKLVSDTGSDNMGQKGKIMLYVKVFISNRYSFLLFSGINIFSLSSSLHSATTFPASPGATCPRLTRRTSRQKIARKPWNGKRFSELCWETLRTQHVLS
jgi:hypothetical protein